MSSPEHYAYNTTGGGRSRSHSRKPRDVSGEVRKLVASGKTDFAALAHLRSKYGNDQNMVNDVFSGYKDRLEFIQRKSRKFKQLIFDRYSKYNLSLEQLQGKARKYQKKYDLSDEEFQLFFKRCFRGLSLFNHVLKI